MNEFWIKLSEYKPEKHVFLGGYRSSRGIYIFAPSLLSDSYVEGRNRCFPETNINGLIEALKSDPKVKALFLIDSGSRGGAGHDWYSLRLVRIEVSLL